MAGILFSLRNLLKQSEEWGKKNQNMGASAATPICILSQ